MTLKQHKGEYPGIFVVKRKPPPAPPKGERKTIRIVWFRNRLEKQLILFETFIFAHVKSPPFGGGLGWASFYHEKQL